MLDVSIFVDVSPSQLVRLYIHYCAYAADFSISVGKATSRSMDKRQITFSFIVQAFLLYMRNNGIAYIICLALSCIFENSG